MNAPLKHINFDWKLAEVCPVFKKDDPSSICNYRRYLINREKIFEKCLNCQLVVRSTLQQSYCSFSQPIVEAIAVRQCFSISLKHGGKAWTKKRLHVVGSVMLDLSKACDLIPHNLLMDKLRVYDLSTQSLSVIKDYFSGRRQCVKVPMPSLTLSR